MPCKSSFTPFFMSSIGSLVRPLSGARHLGISRMSKEQPVLSSGQYCCTLNSIDTVHSSLTVFQAFSIPQTFILVGNVSFLGMDAVKMIIAAKQTKCNRERRNAARDCA